MTDQKLVRGLQLEEGINYQFEILQMSSYCLYRLVFLVVLHCKTKTLNSWQWRWIDTQTCHNKLLLLLGEDIMTHDYILCYCPTETLLFSIDGIFNEQT